MRQDQKSSETPTVRSRPGSSSTSINSPEFKKSALQELKDWVAKGHAKLAEGNQIIEAPNPQPVRPVNDLDRRLAAQKWAELVQVLNEQGEEAFQKKLDEMFPGTQRSQLRNHINRPRDLSTADNPER